MRTVLLRQLVRAERPPACTITVILYENADGAVEVRSQYDQHPGCTITKKEVANALRSLAEEYTR